MLRGVLSSVFCLEDGVSFCNVLCDLCSINNLRYNKKTEKKNMKQIYMKSRVYKCKSSSTKLWLNAVFEFWAVLTLCADVELDF